jgi:hypothetical protein
MKTAAYASDRSSESSDWLSHGGQLQGRSFGPQAEQAKAGTGGIDLLKGPVFVGGMPVRAKLTIGEPNDKYEQEADRVAEQVMGMPDAKPAVQREGLPGEELQTKSLGGAIQREVMPEEEEEIQAKPLSATITPLVQREVMPEEEEEPIQAKLIQRETMPEEEEEPIQAKLIQREEMPEEEEEIQTKKSSEGGFEAGGDFESRLGSSKSGGSPLPEDVRSFMEPRFGADFSGVRVHTGSEAVQMNREVGAQAFAHGQDVYFGAGKGPGKDALTAHELTHVVQQTSLFKNTSTLQREPTTSSTTGTVIPSVESSKSSQIKASSDGLRAKLTNILADLATSADVARSRRLDDTHVLVNSPGVYYDASVSLATGVEAGAEDIKVGIIQTVKSTERIGVYRRKVIGADGKSESKLVTERRFALGLSRDAVTKDVVVAEAPFYATPKVLNDTQKTVKINTEDHPAHVYPTAIRDGKLTEIKGGDHFTSSLAAKQGDTLVHLKNFAWDQNWSIILDDNQSGDGDAPSAHEADTAPETPGGEAGNVGLADPKNTVDSYINLKEAQDGLNQKGICRFLRELPHHGSESHALMVEAISKSPIKISVEITVEKTKNRWGADKIAVTASAYSDDTKYLELDDGGKGTAEFPANEIYKPEYLSESTVIGLWIDGELTKWPFPFNGNPTASKIHRGRETYNMMYRLIL